MKRILTKALAVTLVFTLVMSACAVIVSADANIDAAIEKLNEEKTNLEQIKELMNSATYDTYLTLYGGYEKGTSIAEINGNDYLPEATTAEVASENIEGIDCLTISDSGRVSWKFNIDDEGLYNCKIEYYPVKGRGSTIERAILLDGTYPFKEARYVFMNGVWRNQYEEISDAAPRGFELDANGNEVRPSNIESPEWCETFAKDSTGYFAEPFDFYLTAGEHIVTFEAVQEPVAIKSIKFYAAEDTKTYEEVYAEYEAAGYKDVSADQSVKIDAEFPDSTSTDLIYPIYDRTSPISDPQDASLICLNTIGGSKWTDAGQTISWKFKVNESGLYTIGMRFKQDVNSGLFSSRALRINGEYPFEEAKSLSFKYDSSWQSCLLGDGEDTVYRFYFEAGEEYTLTMEAVLGGMASILREVELSMTTINNYYLKILMLTGPNPDIYRDYEFKKNLPEVLEGMLEESKRLYEISDRLEETVGLKGEDSVILDNTAWLLETMGSDEDKIAGNFSDMKDKVASLGTWIMNTKSQPLEIDYMTIQSAQAEIPRADANFGESLVFEFKSFIMSFFSDYSSLGTKVNEAGEVETTNPIEVWTATSRDQSQIIRSMIDDTFTPKTGINVDLKLVAVGTLLPATLSGTGPDVSLSNASADVINYAIRSAVLPISDLEGFDEVTKRFDASAMGPLTLYNVAYALPETETFSMLFYRKDVFAELDMEVPETWDDVYDILPVLQSNNLQFGFPNSMAGELIFLYQRGEGLYKPGIGEVSEDGIDYTYGMEINLDSNVALDCFKEMCELFTMYNFPYAYDFANRFRSGEMPIAVADYTMYNQLQVFAPEIRGLWEFTLLPGTKDEDGNINHDSAGTVTGVMMMNGCENKDEAWEFMKWWTDTDAQSTFGKEKKALLGASGQYATANLEALNSQPWTASDRDNLELQFQHLTYTPEMPGGYIVTRYISFAFLAVYNELEDPVSTMLGYIDDINSELSRKRQEFDLPILEDYADRDDKDKETATTADKADTSDKTEASSETTSSEDTSATTAAATPDNTKN